MPIFRPLKRLSWPLQSPNFNGICVLLPAVAQFNFLFSHWPRIRPLRPVLGKGTYFYCMVKAILWCNRTLANIFIKKTWRHKGFCIQKLWRHCNKQMDQTWIHFKQVWTSQRLLLYKWQQIATPPGGRSLSCPYRGFSLPWGIALHSVFYISNWLLNSASGCLIFSER